MVEKHTLQPFEIPAVADGEIILLEEVEDQIFAQKMIGDGFAIRPTGNTIYAPVDCKIGQVAPTRHAVYLFLSDDVKLLIHIGIDTIEMKGDGFKTNLSKGLEVKKGEPLIEFDLELIREEGFDPVIAVILLDGSEQAYDSTIYPTEKAIANESLAMLVEVKNQTD